MSTDMTNPDEQRPPHLRLVTDDDEPEASSPLLGHNGPPPDDAPDILPPSDIRPSESEAAYNAAIASHVAELAAVAQSHAKRKAWSARLDRQSLLGVAIDIEVARQLPKQHETQREAKRRLRLDHMLLDIAEERDWNIALATQMGDEQSAREAVARYEYRVKLLEAEFKYPDRSTTFRYIAAGVLKGVDAMNAQDHRYLTAKGWELAPKIPTGWGANGVVVQLIKAALAKAGEHMSDKGIESKLNDEFRGKRDR